MSADLEQRLRDSLARQAQASAPVRTDPWGAFVVQERRHRRTRMARRLVTGVASAALLATITVGVVPVPEVVPGIEFAGPFGHDLLRDEPTRGSLAGNALWLKSLRRTIQFEDRDGWRVVDRDGMQFHFVGDVPGGRVALVTVTLQKGLLRDRQTAWYAGPPNATAAQMDVMSNQDPEIVSTLMSGSNTGTGYLVVVGPVGSKVRTSLDPTYGADGRRHTTWKEAGADGLAVVALPPTPRAPRAVVQVTRNGRTLFNGAPSMAWSSAGELPAITAERVRPILDRARTSTPVDPQTVTAWVRDAVRNAGQKPESTQFRIPWVGAVQGRPAALVELRTVGGGIVYYVYGASTEGPDGQGGLSPRARYLRLLVPAEHGDTRPILWRERKPDGSAATTVDVVLSPRTERAELVRSGRATRITPDADGLVVLPVPVGEKVSVRAYDAKNRLLGDTPLPDPEVDPGRFPGVDRGTRLVD